MLMAGTLMPNSNANQTSVVPTGLGMLRNPYCGKCLNANGDCSNDNSVILYDCDLSDYNNVWSFGSDGTIKNAGCNRCINLSGDGGDDKTPIVMYDCYDPHTGAPPSNNLWRFNNTGDRAIRSYDWDKCVNIDGGNCDDKTDVLQYSCYDATTGRITWNNIWEWLPVSSTK